MVVGTTVTAIGITKIWERNLRLWSAELLFSLPFASVLPLLRLRSKYSHEKYTLSEVVLRHSPVSDTLQPHWLCLPGSSVHVILQARILEWVAIPFLKESSHPMHWTWVSCIAGGFFIVWAIRIALSDVTRAQTFWKQE